MPLPVIAGAAALGALRHVVLGAGAASIVGSVKEFFVGKPAGGAVPSVRGTVPGAGLPPLPPGPAPLGVPLLPLALAAAAVVWWRAQGRRRGPRFR